MIVLTFAPTSSKLFLMGTGNGRLDASNFKGHMLQSYPFIEPYLPRQNIKNL